MPILKLTCPGAPANWDARSYMNPNFILSRDWKVKVNCDISHADAWFVLENLISESEQCVVPKGMTFLGTTETCYDQDWVISNKFNLDFYNQFDHTFSTFIHSLEQSYSSPPFLPWMIFANHGPSIWQQPSYREISQCIPDLDSKQKKIAVFCSTQNLTAGHRVRLKFVELLKSHFGDTLLWYGNGINSTKDKWDVLKNFQYSLVLENQSTYNVVTEKIVDSFLSVTFPFYWGAPNVGDYFLEDGLQIVDINSPREAILAIEAALEGNFFEKKIDSLMQNRDVAMNDFNFLHRILKIVDSYYKTSSKISHQKKLFSVNFLKESLGFSGDKLSSRISMKLSRIDARHHSNYAPLFREFMVFLYRISEKLKPGNRMRIKRDV